MSLRNRFRRLLRRGSAWEPGLVARPPVPAPGERIGPPDFVGIGVQKAGTTWWFHNLLTHPDVRGPAGGRKELHFFNRLLLGQGALEDYAGWFPRRPGQVVGEFTPAYMSQPWTPSLLAAAAPGAKLIVLLRDPLDRLLSGLTHNHERRRILTPELVGDAVHRSLYAPQLERVFDHHAQVLVLQFEACRADPQGQFDRTCAFLGLARHTLPSDVPRNPTRTSPVQLHPVVLGAVRPLLVADARRTAALVDLDLGLWGCV